MANLNKSRTEGSATGTEHPLARGLVAWWLPDGAGRLANVIAPPAPEACDMNWLLVAGINDPDGE